MRLVVGLGLAACGMLSPLSPRAVEPPAIGLSHVPVAVADLNRAASDFERLGFALKVGRVHDDGIVNRHAKFTDGTEVERSSPRRRRPMRSPGITAGSWLKVTAPPFCRCIPSPWTLPSSALAAAGLPVHRGGACWTFPTDMRWAMCSSRD